MIITKKNTITCHTTDTIKSSNTIFCIKGKEYKVVKPETFRHHEYVIVISEIDENHMFTTKSLGDWFIRKGLIIEKQINEESFKTITYTKFLI